MEKLAHIPHLERFQRFKPYGRLAPRAVCVLPVEAIHPVIRLAHRRVHPAELPLRLPERIIFDHELMLFLRGEGEIRLGATRYAFAPHRLFFVPPFVAHSVDSDGSSDHLAVHFDLAPGVPPTPRDAWRRKPYDVRLSYGLALPTQLELVEGDAITHVFAEMVRAFGHRTPLGRLEARVCLQRILLWLLTRPSGTEGVASSTATVQRHRVRIERAIEFMKSHLREKLGVTDLARAAKLSPSRFAHLFHEWTGHSPAEYLRRLRVETARQLLADPDRSIKEIAEHVGVADPYHFSRMFRHVDGLAPTQYREALLSRARR